MYKKDYEFFAAMFKRMLNHPRQCLYRSDIEIEAEKVIAKFKKDNSKFSANKFRDACGLT